MKTMRTFTIPIENCFWQILIVILTIGFAVPFSDESEQNLSPHIVNTKYGSLRGIVVKFDSQSTLDSIEAYLGVAYATPPIGSLRFMPPVTPTHWRGIREANQLSCVCPQRIPLTNLIMNNSVEALKRIPLQRFEYMRKLIPLLTNQSEDCLYLNIFTPIIAQTASQMPSVKMKVPVVVFIHGESYDWNSGNVYDGSVLSSFGQVIIVTLNYRLGILGFLPAMVDGAVRGNYGLMDQVAALHWIQENIEEFGGLPTNVTIIGHGYGAACAHLLMISPMAKGLFSRVILMSGSALSPWAIARDADLYAKNIAQRLKCPIHDNALMVECLRQKTVDELFSVNYEVPDHLTAFGPIIDGIVVPSEPKYLIQAQSDNRGLRFDHHYDLLIGVTRVEAPPVFNSHEERHGIDIIRRDRILRTLVRNLFDFHQQAILLTLINEYTDWTRPVEHPINLLDSLLDIMSDALVVAPAIETSDLHSKLPLPTKPYQHRQSSARLTPKGKTFFYVFVHQSEEGSKFHQRLGCSHGEELAYIFGAPLSQHLLRKSIAHFASNYSRTEMSLSEGVMTYWTNFAKYGDPNIWPFELDSNGDRTKGRFENIVWPPYDLTQRKYLMLGLKPKVRDHYHSHRLSFWLNLIPRLHHPGEEKVYLRHHLLSDHENPSSYDGVVRQIAFKFFSPIPNKTVSITSSANISATIRKKYNFFMTTPTAELNINDDAVYDDTITTESVFNFFNADNNNIESIDQSDNQTEILRSYMNKSETNALVPNANYSTALLVTIAIGCSLLVLNMLIFAGVYYQLDKNSMSKFKRNDANSKRNETYDHHSHYHYHDSYGDESQEMKILSTPNKKVSIHQNCVNSNQKNRVKIINPKLSNYKVNEKHGILFSESVAECSEHSSESNATFTSFEQFHGSSVPSCLSSSSDKTNKTKIYVPIIHANSNDSLVPEIRV